MGPSLRKLGLAAHLTVSVGWIGAVASYLALDLTAATGNDEQTLRAAYRGMDLIASYVIVPLALTTLATGLVVSLGTRWGLFRHYWVVTSFLLTIFATVVLFREAGIIGAYADVASDPAASPSSIRELPSTLLHSMGGAAVLLVILVLNVYKPRGLTRFGRRKEGKAPRAAD